VWWGRLLHNWVFFFLTSTKWHATFLHVQGEKELLQLLASETQQLSPDFICSVECHTYLHGG
jgi:hypothetical protein